LSATLGKRH